MCFMLSDKSFPRFEICLITHLVSLYLGIFAPFADQAREPLACSIECHNSKDEEAWLNGQSIIQYNGSN